MNRIKKLLTLLHAPHAVLAEETADNNRPYNNGPIVVDDSIAPLAQTDALPSPSSTSGYGPNPATLMKLQRLRSVRQQSIRNGRVMLSWTAACRQIAIDPKTARQHAPELRAHWDDPSYQ